MENKITDINDLVLQISVMGMSPLLSDDIWKFYGYDKRPKHGNMWNKIFPKMFALENFIQKEILIMCLIDVLNGIKKSTESLDTKLIISIGVVDKFLSTTKHLFPSDLFMEYFFASYAQYFKSDSSKIHETIILKAKQILDEKDFIKFMVGTINLFTIKHDDLLLRSDYVKDTIEKSHKENKLIISMPNETYKKYLMSIEKIVLNYDI